MPGLFFWTFPSRTAQAVSDASRHLKLRKSGSTILPRWLITQ